MKYSLFATLVLFVAIAAGCKKHDKNCGCNASYSGGMQVIKNCTGTYLRYQQKDYQVCNTSALAAYDNGNSVNASFNKISGCDSIPPIVCLMLHANEGYVEVVCARPLDD